MHPCPRVTIISICFMIFNGLEMAKKNSFEISGVDDVCRDGKLPRFAGWNIARELRTCTRIYGNPASTTRGLQNYCPIDRLLLFAWG